MTGFDFWAIILACVLAVVSATLGLIRSFKKGATWWRWLIDGLTIPLAIGLIVVAICS